MHREITIKVGKGQITIEEKAAPFLRGKTVILHLQRMPGPCNDDSCQIQYTLSARLDEHGNSTNYRELSEGDFRILADPMVIRSIDAGRENVVLRYTRSGKFKIKGFYL